MMPRALTVLCLLPLLAFGHWAMDFDEDFAAAWGSTDVIDGLIGRWTFDDTATDSVGTNNRVWTGTAAYSTGKIGKAASLDESSYITLTPDGRSDFALQEYTVSMWVYSDNIFSFLPLWSYDYISHTSSPQYAQSVVVYANNSIVYAWNVSGSSVAYVSTSANSVTDGGWHYVTCTFRSGSQNIYVDAILVASSKRTNAVVYYEQPVWVGHSNFATAPPCLIDDVRFYNRAISSNEVATIFNLYK